MKTNQQTAGAHEESKRVAVLAALNDSVRRRMTGCIMTSGVAELELLLTDIFEKVKTYDDFNDDNDPYGEHDFGSFELLGIKFFWKIDYYDQTLQHWCDPLDPRCHRQLTIMRADEY